MMPIMIMSILKIWMHREKLNLYKKLYKSPEMDYITSIKDRQVIGCEIMKINGHSAISLTAQGKFLQYKVIQEMLEIFFGEHIVSIDLICYKSNSPLLHREIVTIFRSIAPARQ